MTVRYYLSPFTTIQAHDGPLMTPTVETYPHTAMSAVYDTANPTWALCVVEATDHTPMLADTTIAALPDFSFDGTIRGMAQQARTALTNALTQFGLTTTIQVGNNDAWRTIIRQIGQQHLPTFDENAFSTTVT